MLYARFLFMPTALISGFGKVYLQITYNAANHWVHNHWLGYQTYVGIVAGADACLEPLAKHHHAPAAAQPY